LTPLFEEEVGFDTQFGERETQPHRPAGILVYVSLFDHVSDSAYQFEHTLRRHLNCIKTHPVAPPRRSVRPFGKKEASR
jgi:hypothetical protein